VVKKTQDDSIAFLLNKTRQLTHQYKSGKTAKSVQPKQVVVVSENAKPDGAPIKLYQSTHQRYYLVSASLISSQAGYPDHLLDLARLVPSALRGVVVPSLAVASLADGKLEILRHAIA